MTALLIFDTSHLLQRLANWEGREYRKEKDHEKDVKKEKEKREDMVSSGNMDTISIL